MKNSQGKPGTIGLNDSNLGEATEVVLIGKLRALEDSTGREKQYHNQWPKGVPLQARKTKNKINQSKQKQGNGHK